jgi:hypothetical protein
MRWMYALVAVGILSAFALLLLTGQYIEEGPVVASLTPDHGLHTGDLFVIGGWAVGVTALLQLVRAPGPIRPS